MGRKKSPGLQKRNDLWHIDKRAFGRRICCSCETSDLEEAEKFLSHKLDELRQATVYGVRPNRNFRAASIKYIKENQDKACIDNDLTYLTQLDPFIGNLTIDCVHIGTLQPYIDKRRKSGVKNRTINYALEVVRRILNLAAGEWLDENGMTWLRSAPKIKLLPQTDSVQPYPLSWDEQRQLLDELPPHLQRMVLFKVNTGCRQQEVCQLRWDWEVQVPELNTSVFLIPKGMVKNRHERLVVLNQIAKSIVDEQRGQNSSHVFTYDEHPIGKINNSAWKKAIARCDFHCRVHDLKHTYGRRLRAAGVSFETRQDLLGHKSHRITTHYSKAELTELIEASNKVCEQGQNRPQLVVLRRVAGA